jgi:flavin reductase (DIM6/NTAB) family NADH-FMN oxidoreductase RutF
MADLSPLPDLPGKPKRLEPIERALLAMSYGVHVIGSRNAAGELNAMLADWVMQVSFQPRLVAVSIENDARTLRYIRETGIFSVNLLHERDGAEIARQVVMPAEGSKIRGRSAQASGVRDKLAGIDYSLSAEDGVPLLNDALGWYLCDAEQFVPAGDHTVVIARVTDGDVIRSGEMLTERELGWEYAG